ncbi:MAG: site-specific DNA-methyltransferase [Planctomycetota bacterium]
MAEMLSPSIQKLGRHRLCLGDARDSAAFSALFPRLERSRRASLVVTSPPYYNQRDYSTWASYDDYLADMDRVIELMAAYCAETCACCWIIGDSVRDRADIPADHSVLFRRHGWRFRDKIAWVKPTAAYSIPRSRHIDRGRYFPALRWETVLVFTRARHPCFDLEDVPLVKRHDTNVWEIQHVVGSAQSRIGHPAVFPEELVRRCVRAYSRKNDVVLDPFLGSGTTLLVCEELRRRCFGIEISPRYLDLAVSRWRWRQGSSRRHILARN